MILQMNQRLVILKSLIEIYYSLPLNCNMEFHFQDYIHRVGRTARGDKGKGSALLFLLPEELKFLIYLKACVNNIIYAPLPPSDTTQIMRIHICIGCLQAARVTLTEYEFNQKNVPNLQSHLVSIFFQNNRPFPFLFHVVVITFIVEQEKIVSDNYFLNQSAKEAYRSYVLAYDSHSMKDIFNVHQLDLQVNVL